MIANTERLSLSGRLARPVADAAAHPVGAPRPARRPRVLGRGDLIFVTIGSILPFDRLVRAMDEWAAARIRAMRKGGTLAGLSIKDLIGEGRT